MTFNERVPMIFAPYRRASLRAGDVLNPNLAAQNQQTLKLDTT